MIDISKYDKADVLRVLYNNAQPLGMGFLRYEQGDMSYKEASEYLSGKRAVPDYAMLGPDKYFDYLKGRVLKVDLSGNKINPELYDRDYGEGAAQRAIDSLDE